eukprot:gene19125-24961_t
MIDDVDTIDDNGPSIMELMIKEQEKAKIIKDKEDNIINEKSTKTFANGFKKGFFNNKPSKELLDIPVDNKVSKTSNRIDDLVTIKPSENNKHKSELVINEVQEVLSNDNKEISEKLKTNEWVTPDLTLKLQTNPIISKGLQGPKCIQALQTMQQNPNDLSKRQSIDPVVNTFLQEFGKVMSEHFFQLANQTENNKSPDKKSNDINSNSITKSPVIQEIGPIQADVMSRKSDILNSTSNIDQSKVDKVLNDPELRELLLSNEMQVVLKECEDPIKFNKYMKDPVIANKIKKLYDNGLVGTTM